MNENYLNSIYQQIAQTINETIPEEWSKVFSREKPILLIT